MRSHFGEKKKKQKKVFFHQVNYCKIPQRNESKNKRLERGKRVLKGHKVIKKNEKKNSKNFFLVDNCIH